MQQPMEAFFQAVLTHSDASHCSMYTSWYFYSNFMICKYNLRSVEKLQFSAFHPASCKSLPGAISDWLTETGMQGCPCNVPQVRPIKASLASHDLGPLRSNYMFSFTEQKCVNAICSISCLLALLVRGIVPAFSLILILIRAAQQVLANRIHLTSQYLKIF